MKKLLALLAVLLMLTGCSSAPAQKTDEELMAEGWVKNPLENGYILQAELPDQYLQPISEFVSIDW